MIDTRLVLLEGPVGSGKSTTGERLAKRLQVRGMNARYLFGFDSAHPIATRCEALARRVFGGESAEPPLLDPEDERLFTAPQWRRLAERLGREDEILVVEGKYFQQCLEYVYLAGASRGAIVSLQAELVDAMKAARPAAIFFRQSDPRAHRRRVVAGRPQSWPAALGSLFALHPFGARTGAEGAAAFEEFYEEWQPIEDELVDRHPEPKLVLVDADRDRAAAGRAIDAFLAG